MKNILKRCLYVCLFFSVSSFAEVSDNTMSIRALENGVTHGAGVAGTFDSMWGFTYRRHFPNNIGVVSTLGGSFLNQESKVGLSSGVLFTLFHHYFPGFGLKEASARVLLGVNAMGMYGRDIRPNVDVNLRNSFIFGASVAPGIEYFLNRNFAINVEMPWLTKFRVRNKDVLFEGSAPTFSAGVTYYL